MSSINPKEAKRDLIIGAAVGVFSQKGYYYTKMEEIAAAAGIGKGTIYEYFESKLQLLQEIMERSFRLYEQSMKVDANEQSIDVMIYRLVEGHFKFCQENRSLPRILFGDTGVMDSEVHEWLWQKRKQKEIYLQSIIEASIVGGEIRPLDAHLLTIMVSGILSNIWVPVLADGWDIDAGVAAGQLTDIIMNGIRK